MFKALSDLFAKEPSPKAQPITADLAVAALLIHVARADGEFSATERDLMPQLLKTHFDLDDEAVTKIIKSAEESDAEAVDLYRFTMVITQLEMQERINIIEMIWKIVFADEHNHELEDNLVWRIAELIGVSARDRTTLRAKMRSASQSG